MKKNLNRRDFIRITAIGAGVLALGGIGLKQLIEAGEAKTVSQTRSLLGTYVTITLADTDEAKAKNASSAAFAEIERLSASMNRFDPASELSILNSTGQINNASSELIGVIQKALSYSTITGGAYDVTMLPLQNLYQNWNWNPTASGGYIPPDDMDISAARELINYQNVVINGKDITLTQQGMGVTLDSLAPGYIVDQAANVIRASGFSQVLIGGDSDMSLRGLRQDGTPWHLGIQDPRALDPDSLFTAFGYTNGSIATSGDYEDAYTSDFLWNAIIDPRTGYSPQELASATVLAPDTVTADALSTSVMLLGVTDGLALLGSIPNVNGFLIDKNMKSYTTPGFRAATSQLE